MAGSQAIVQPLFDDLILHISPDKFYFESLTATQVGNMIWHLIKCEQANLYTLTKALILWKYTNLFLYCLFSELNILKSYQSFLILLCYFIGGVRYRQDHIWNKFAVKQWTNPRLGSSDPNRRNPWSGFLGFGALSPCGYQKN